MNKVLIVDDNLAVLEIISESLNEIFDLTISLATNVEEAISHLKQNEIDFIICDLELPDGNGVDVLSYLKENKPKIPLIFFTGDFTFQHPIVFPLVTVINNKDYEKLFREVIKHSSFTQRVFY